MASETLSHDDPYLDGEEIFPEEIPSELLERVSNNHAHLIEVTLQVKRGGKWSTMRSGRQAWTEQPPSTQAHDISTKLVESARRDAEKNGEGQRYRARLRCSQNNHEYSRFATVRGVLSEAGAFMIVDDENSTDADPMRVLIDAKAQSDQVAFQAMTTVLDAVKGYASIANSFNVLLCAAGDVFAKHAAGQGDLLRIQMEMESNNHSHAERMAKMDKGFGLLEKPVTRIGDEIIEHVVTAMRDKRGGKSGPKTSGRPRPSPRAASVCANATTLEDIFGALSEDELAKVQKLMSADEWKLIQTARKASSDTIFDGVFTRFYELLCARGDEGTTAWIKDLTEIVGQPAIVKIGFLIQRVEKARK